MFSYNESGQRGLADEKAVIAWLKAKGYVVIKSSTYEDRELDIDIWLRPRAQVDPKRPTHQPVSIKCLHDGAKYNNVGVEVDVLTVDSEGNHKWQGSSWWQNGAATYYLILQKNDIFKLSKRKLKEAWERGLIEPERITSLKPSTVEKQIAMGHPHIDAKCAYFNRDTLLKLNIMKRVGTLNNERPKVYGAVCPVKFKRLAEAVDVRCSSPYRD